MNYSILKKKRPSLMYLGSFIGLAMFPSAILYSTGLNVFWSILLGVSLTGIYAYMKDKKDEKEKQNKKQLTSVLGGPMSKEEEKGWDEWFEFTDTEEQIEAKKFARQHDLDEGEVLDRLERTGSYQ